MAVVKGSQKAYIPAPEGTFQAVCVDEVLMPDQETPWGNKDKLRVTWQIEERVTEESFTDFHGRQPTADEFKTVISKRYTVSAFYTATLGSSNKPSNLRKLLQSWRGSKVTQDEDRNGFDFEKMVGANCMLQIIHNEPEPGKLYANVGAVMPINRAQQKMAPEDFVRAKDREENKAANAAPAVETDADIPF